ncbi:hypothetical protein BDW59DRAFT_171978 [Aspergillus cavernicola]|uniref:PRISE-like Rossmann-fold domain-containing protein n=1 Tax=Aspergillus cavernicola TaxID=176166 RepID=A0ABR4IE98_9EURO
MVSAIVTGATGITGSAIVHHLCKDPSYNKVLCRHGKKLSGISAEYIYFCAYMARDDSEELCRINGTMLSNFIQALISGAVKNLKRFILTCGFKQYGVHLGNCKQPLLEDDPVLEGKVGNETWPPLFYLTQQRILKEAANKSQWEWIVALPEDVIGFAKGNFMNEATAIGLYCAVSKTLPGSEFPFPGCKSGYLTFNTWTSVNLHARFCLWAATAPRAGNNIFNNLWPRLAQRFGCKIPNPMFPHGGTPDTKGYGDFEASTVRMPNKHPLSARAQDIGVSADPAKADPPTLFSQINPEKWAQRKDVNDAWVKKATWDFLTFALGRDWSCVGSMSKVRKLGWTWGEFEETLDVLEKEGILPPVD